MVAGAGITMQPSASRRFVAVLACAVICTLHAGCQHRRSRQTPEGNASFRFIEPPPPPQLKGSVTLDVAQTGEISLPAEAIPPLAVPVYPAAALRTRSFGTSVSVHVVVDAKGRVAEVTPSRFGFTMPSPYAQEFFAAVERAVRQWKFKPAEIQFTEPAVREGVEVRTLTRREPIEATFDVTFLFTSTGAVVMP
jgi:Gram-negative bacterial TonB protein C-terminal